MYLHIPLFTHGQDRTIAVWDMKSPKDIVLRRVLVGHRAAVNVVDFDEKYIVSASGDRTIKVHVCVGGGEEGGVGVVGGGGRRRGGKGTRRERSFVLSWNCLSTDGQRIL